MQTSKPLQQQQLPVHTAPIGGFYTIATARSNWSNCDPGPKVNKGKEFVKVEFITALGRTKQLLANTQFKQFAVELVPPLWQTRAAGLLVKCV